MNLCFSAPQNVNAAAGFGASYGGGSSTGGNSAFSATYSKNYNGDFFSNIFNVRNIFNFYYK